jgi:hypothetical protein
MKSIITIASCIIKFGLVDTTNSVKLEGKGKSKDSEAGKNLTIYVSM